MITKIIIGCSPKVSNRYWSSCLSNDYKHTINLIGYRSEHTVPHYQAFPPAQTAQLQPFPTTNHVSPSLQWSQSNKHSAAAWSFVSKWQMQFWQTLHSTFTLNRCLLPLIKNVESRIELPLSNRLGVFSFCPGWKSFHIPFLRGQRSASALPACPPWLPHAEWLVLTPSLPAAAILFNMWERFQGCQVLCGSDVRPEPEHSMLVASAKLWST